MVGNLDVDVEQQQRIGHLLGPLPPEMRNDTAFMDRIHTYAPGWDFPKLNPTDHLTDHFGLVSDFLSECWSRLRSENRVSVMQGRVHLGGALSGRDIEAVNKTVSGLVKLVFPDPEMAVSDDDLEWIVRLALEARRRVKEQQIHHTPKHGSWLNVAEIELSALGKRLPRRVGDAAALARHVAAIEQDRNQRARRCDWHFTTADARIKLKRLYPSLEER